MSTESHDVVNLSGAKVGSVNLDANVFSVRALPDLVQQTVRWQRAKKRAGTHATLTRTLMIGGNTKPFKQKGTGNARQGSKVSPLMVGGAVTFGPQPRSYEFSIPKKVRAKALASVLSDKKRAGGLLVVDELKVESAKTKDFVKVIGQLGLTDKKVLLVVPSDACAEGCCKLDRAARNIPGVRLVNVAGVNVYDVVNSDNVVVTQAALSALQDRIKAAAAKCSAKCKQGE